MSGSITSTLLLAASGAVAYLGFVSGNMAASALGLGELGFLGGLAGLICALSLMERLLQLWRAAKR